jgi:hypothetical protein
MVISSAKREKFLRKCFLKPWGRHSSLRSESLRPEGLPKPTVSDKFTEILTLLLFACAVPFSPQVWRDARVLVIGAILRSWCVADAQCVPCCG